MEPCASKNRPLEIRDLGLCKYATALQEQRAAVRAVKDGAIEALFLVEHPATYTLGRKGQRMTASDIVATDSMGTGDDSSAPELVEVERGGEATFHNPGQLVAYPILKLEGAERDVHLYLRKLEQVLIAVLARYGLKCEARKDATGVWLVGENKKIASIGIAVTGWVTYHGIALNVRNDLSGFARIQPCGYSASVMTSIEERLGGSCPSIEGVKTDFIGCFESAFGRAAVWVKTTKDVAEQGALDMPISHHSL